MIVGLALALALVAPLDAMRLIRPGIRSPALQMCASEVAEVGVEVGVEAAARDVRNLLRLELVRSFVAATERGDAATLMQLCTDDFLYKTHRATTSSLLAAKDRFATRLPAPSKAREKNACPRPGVLAPVLRLGRTRLRTSSASRAPTSSCATSSSSQCHS